MRSIYGKGSVVLATALVLCAVVAASASASQWYVGGKALTGSEKLAETVKVEEPIVFTIADNGTPAYDPTITCTSAKTSGAEVTAPGTLKTKALALEGCTLKVPGEEAFCKLQGSKIATLALEAKMALGSKSPEDTSEITAGNKTKTWFSFNGGGSCEEYAGEELIDGTTLLADSKGQTEATEQEFVGEGKLNGGLKWYANPVYLTGKLKLKLASGKAWSFH